MLITVAAVFDALDGRTARRFKTQSAFGAALDSLSDLVVFGVVPVEFVCLGAPRFRHCAGGNIVLCRLYCVKTGRLIGITP